MHSVALSLWFLTALPNGNPWQHVRQDDAMQVWARTVPESNIREVKAETVIDASIDRIWDVLDDVDSYAAFMPYLVEARQVPHEPGQKKEKLEYFRVNPPLVSQRDYVIKIDAEQDRAKGEYVRRWSTAPHVDMPRRKDSIRLDVCDGSWTLKKQVDGKTKVTYWVYTDPAGSIPGWVANQANSRSVPDVLEAVRNRAQDPTWTR